MSLIIISSLLLEASFVGFLRLGADAVLFAQ